MQQRSKKKGIVLVTTMLSVVLVIMLLSAVVYSNMGSLRLTSNFYDRETALMAADSGMQYAVTRLQKDITWRAVDKYSLKPSQTKSVLHVEEENGNVVGTVTLANGRKAAFRIKFNCEDGDSGLDHMKNSAKPLDMVNVSANNLFSTASAEAVIADKNGKVAVDKSGKPKKVEFKDESGKVCTYPFSIPKQTCRLVVQGLAGTGIRDAEPKDLFDIASRSSKGSVTPVCVECYLAIDTENMYTDAVTCSGGKLTAKSDSLLIAEAKGAVGSNIRSLKDVNININKKLNYNTGKIYAHSGVSVTENKKDVTKDYVGGKINNKDSFPELKWEDVPKASSKSPRITAGTYVWENVKGSDTPQLMFYPGTYKDVKSLKGKGQPATLPSTVNLDSKNLIMTVNGDTYVSGDFVLLSKTKNRPSIGFLNTSDTKAPILTSSGEMVIRGAMVGSGALTSQGNITIQGPSVLESTPDIGVSIYSNKDINIVDIDKTTKKYSDRKKGAKQASFIPDRDSADYTGDGFVQCEGSPSGSKEEYMAELRETAKTYFISQGAHEQCPHCIQLYDDMIYQLINGGFDPSEEIDINMLPPDDCNGLKNSCLYNAVKAQAITDYGLIYYYEEEDPDLSAEFGTDNIDEAVQAYEEINPDNSSETKKQQLMSLISRYNSLKYSDLDLSGVLYAMGNINIDIKGTLNVTGSVIAYGDSSDSGNINMKAGKIGLISDPAYINNLLDLSKSRQLKKGIYCTY